MSGIVIVDLPDRPGGKETRSLIPFVHPHAQKNLVSGRYQGDLPTCIVKLDPANKLSYPELMAAARVEIDRLQAERQKIEKKLKPIEKAIAKERKAIEAAKKIKDAGERVRTTMECEAVIERLNTEKRSKEAKSSSYHPRIQDLQKFLDEDPVLVQYQRILTEAQRQRVFWQTWEVRAAEVLEYRQAVVSDPNTPIPEWFVNMIKAGPEVLFTPPELPEGESLTGEMNAGVNLGLVNPATGEVDKSHMFQYQETPPLVEGD
jgi:hypothetical protein